MSHDASSDPRRTNHRTGIAKPSMEFGSIAYFIICIMMTTSQ